MHSRLQVLAQHLVDINTLQESQHLPTIIDFHLLPHHNPHLLPHHIQPTRQLPLPHHLIQRQQINRLFPLNILHSRQFPNTHLYDLLVPKLYEELFAPNIADLIL